MLGLVLEGGGSKGSYQIGACKALQEMDYKFSAVAGTSIGAINGAVVAQGDLERAYQIWSSMSLNKIFDMKEEYLEALQKFELKQDNLSFYWRLARDILNNKGLDTTLMKKILEENINEHKLRKIGIDFGLVTVCLPDLKPLEIFLEDIPQGQLIDYLMASAGLPIFNIGTIDGKNYLDGGFYDNLPIGLLYSRGYRDLIAIRTHSLGIVRKVNKPDLVTTIIEPREELGAILDFSPDNARRNLKLGYYDAYRTIKGLKGMDFYFESDLSEEDYARLLVNLDEEALKVASVMLGIREELSPKMVLSLLAPKILELRQIKIREVAEGTVLTLVEALAKRYSIERFKIYRVSELLKILAERLQEVREPLALAEEIQVKTTFTPFLTKISREKIIEKLALVLLTRIK